MLSQPAVKFYAQLARFLKDFPQLGQTVPSGVALLFQFVEALYYFLSVGFVLRLAVRGVPFDLPIEQLREVVGKHDEGGLHFLRVKAFVPGFGFVRFVFQLVETFFNPPAHEVELRDDSGADALAGVG